MSIAASTIINRVRNQLIDTGAFGPLRWTDAELLQWITDGQRTIVAASPRASALTAIVQLVTGTKQSIPAAGYQLITVYRNMGANGTTPGSALERIQRAIMDTQYPAWHTATAVAAPYAIMWDPSDPAAFYVSPPSDGTGKVELSYAVEPVDLVLTTDLLVVKDIYATPLFDYTMARATQKDSDYAPGMATTNMYMAAFTAFLAALMKDEMTLATQMGKT